MKEWHCVLYGQPQGPFSEERMREMALRGEIAGDTLVWSGSTPEDTARGWVPAAETEFAQFFPASEQAPEPLRAPLLSQMPPVAAASQAELSPESRTEEPKDALREETPRPLPRVEPFAGPPRAPLLSQMPPAADAQQAEIPSEPVRAPLLSQTMQPGPSFGNAAPPEGRFERASSAISGLGQALSSRAADVAKAARNLHGVSPAALPLAALAPRENRLAASMINFTIPPAFFLIFKSLPAFLFFDMRILAFAVAGVTALIALVYVGSSFYYLNRDGQSLGKKAMGVRIVGLDQDLAPIWRTAGLRWIPCCLVLLLLYLKPYLGVAVFLLDTGFIFRKDQRTLHDLIAGTVVVKAQAEERAPEA